MKDFPNTTEPEKFENPEIAILEAKATKAFLEAERLADEGKDDTEAYSIAIERGFSCLETIKSLSNYER